jgi:hypothetical protein
MNERAYEPGTTTPAVASFPNAPIDGGRRRLVRGVGGGAGVLLAVSAKTALGGTTGSGTCQSPSAAMSGNASPKPTNSTCSGGCSPGYWVQPKHSGNWPTAGCVFPTFKNITVIDCSTTYSNIKSADIKDQGTLLTSAFPGAPSGIGMWYALNSPTDTATFGTKGQLLRHLSAAWLNAGYFKTGSQLYPITRQQLTDMWNAVKFGGTYCPTSSCTSGWTADQVVSYISGMYDINSTPENVCKK